MSKSIKVVRSAVAIVLALFSVFFIFYSARLLYVTRGLTTIRAGGQGVYVGAIVFPLLALLFGGAAWWCLRRLPKT